MRLPNIGLKHTVLCHIKLFEFENWAVIAIGGIGVDEQIAYKLA